MRILAALDGSPLAETILPFVQTLARRTGGHVTLLHVTPVPEDVPRMPGHPSLDEIVQRNGELAEGYLHGHRQNLNLAGVNGAVAIATGRPAAEIVRYAERAGIDLIALATHGRSGVQSWAHGSVADDVLRTSSTPLLLMRPDARWTTAPHDIARVVVPLDGSPEAEEALAMATDLAQRGHLPLVLLRCVEPPTFAFADPAGVPYVGLKAVMDAMTKDARDYLEGVATRLRERGLTVTPEVLSAPAADGIAAHVRRQPRSLVVLATHARSGWRRALLGSVARRVVRTAPGPIVVCPPRTAASVHTTDHPETRAAASA